MTITRLKDGGHNIQSTRGGTWVSEQQDVNWIDSEGRLLHGKHKGELAESVSISDHSYIRWLVDNIENMNEEDREILSSLLYYRRS